MRKLHKKTLDCARTTSPLTSAVARMLLLRSERPGACNPRGYVFEAIDPHKFVDTQQHHKKSKLLNTTQIADTETRVCLVVALFE
jgi:hypothetical protein